MKKDFDISLENSYSIKTYNIEYNDMLYIYTIEYNDKGLFEYDLTRDDEEDITDEEYEELNEIVNSITDWEQYE